MFNYRGTLCRLSTDDAQGPHDVLGQKPRLEPQWHLPSEDEVEFANELLHQYLTPAVEELRYLRSTEPGTAMTAEQASARLRNALKVITAVARVGPHVMHEADLPLHPEAVPTDKVSRWLQRN